MITIPKGATVVFEGLSPGDADFTSDVYGSFNVSKAIRILQLNNAVPRLCSMTRADAKELLSRRDINPDGVAALLRNPKRIRVPLVAAQMEPEPTPDSTVIIDGVHRLSAMLYADAQLDPILFRCYIYPYSQIERIKITPYIIHEDGRREAMSHEDLLKQTWGKW